jgi:acyl carrier protein
MPSKDRVAEYIAVQLGVDRDRILNNPQIWNEIAADSLDTVELLMMIEQEYRDD